MLVKLNTAVFLHYYDTNGDLQSEVNFYLTCKQFGIYKVQFNNYNF